MTLSVGIVGLPNVGKSTLFNAITDQAVDAENYPFCTIDPNSGIVEVPDHRLSELARLSGSEKTIFATIEFTDIAGLVKGASKGEGLGNKFLSNIRETSAIAHVVRCFDDPNVIHVNGAPNPKADIDIINTELLLADFEMADKLRANQEKKAKSQKPDDKIKFQALSKITEALAKNIPVRQVDLDEKERASLSGIHFLTDKRVLYVANVGEDDLGKSNVWVDELNAYAKEQGEEVIILSAKLEAELATLTDEEKKEFLSDYGINEPGLHRLAKQCFGMLGLQTYLTTGPKESRAWTIKQNCTAPQAAGVIHTDFQEGFIRANVISFDDFAQCQGLKIAKEKGLLRQEGKDYVMKDGDIVEFLFNV